MLFLKKHKKTSSSYVRAAGFTLSIFLFPFDVAVILMK